MKRIKFSLKIFIFLGFIFSLPFYIFPDSKTWADWNPNTACSLNGTRIHVGNGLLTIADPPDANNNFKILDTSKSICGDPVSIPSSGLPTYNNNNSLKSEYYDKNKSTEISKIPLTGNIVNDATNPQINNAITSCTGSSCLIYITGNLSISSNIVFTKPVAIFVDGDLLINVATLSHNSSQAGLVFIVGGNVHVTTTVARIDAVIITGGDFCDTGDTTLPTPSCLPSSDPLSDKKLTINGSIITLTSGIIPRFQRTNGNNDQTSNPGEEIIYQAKYSALFRNVFGKDRSTWSEIQ
ncbi:MAG: hypothetical protein V1808_01070 [Candidatus Daviesbacteria bacterium]